MNCMILTAAALLAMLVGVGGCRKTEIRETRPVVTQPAPTVIEHDRPRDVIIEHR